MNTTPQAIQQLIDSIEVCGAVRVPTECLGAVLSVFPILGGGMDCIVINVDGMIVRIVYHDGNWTAEHLVVRGR